MQGILASRICSFLVDRALILILGLIPVWAAELYVRIHPQLEPTPLIPLALPWMLGWYVFYLVILEPLWNGVTPGKYIFGISVLAKNRWRLMIRNLLRPLDAILIYLPGLILRNRRLGDLISGTQILKERRAPTRSQLVHAIWIGCLFCMLPGFLGYLPLLAQPTSAQAQPIQFKGIALCQIPAEQQSLDRAMDSISKAGFDLVRISCAGDRTFDPELLGRVIEAAQKHGLKLMVLVGGHWYHRFDPDWINQQIPQLKLSPAISYWNIGNEEYTEYLGIPRQEIANLSQMLRLLDPARPQIFANHMLLQCPDVGGITGGWLGPVPMGDVIGFNGYNPGLGITWTELVRIWWENQSLDPVTGTVLGSIMNLYFWAGERVPEWIIRSDLGYGYLLHSYGLYAKLQHKPWALTEWGGSPDPTVARAQWNLIAKFNLTGSVFWEWLHLDQDGDGYPENAELYELLSQINRAANERSIASGVGYPGG